MIGYADDMEFDEIIITTYLHSYFRQGIITKTEFILLEKSLRYHELISEIAKDLGLNYESAKKQRQRAIKKIRKIENNCPLTTVKIDFLLLEGGDSK